MESNDNFGASSADSGSGQTDANEFSGSGSTEQSRGTFDFAGSPASDQSNIKDRARGAIGNAGDKLADVGSGLRDKAGNMKQKLANALETGAERLRDRGTGGNLAGATASGSTAIESDGRLAGLSDRVAGGMQASADWIRDADIDGLKTGIERQVKEHPGRTLLIAAGLGYLIGRAFKGDK